MVTASRLLTFVVSLLLTAHLILLGFFGIAAGDGDIWWHLRQGELYLGGHSLPTQDPFAFTTGGREWIKHSWFADILLYLVFLAGGVPGLVLLRLILLFLIALALYRVLRGCGLHPLAVVLLIFVASLVLRIRLFLRPEIFSFLLLLSTMAILLRLRVASPRAAYALLPMQVAWTNVHASFVFGFALPGLVLGANLLPGVRAEPGWGRLSLDRVRVKHLAIVVVCLPLAALLNPHGASMLLFPFRQNSMTRLTFFTEWMDVLSLPQRDPLWWDVIIALGVVLLAFAATAFLLLTWEGRFDPVGWGIVLSIGTYAILRNRALPYFILAVLPLLALALVRVARHLPARGSAGSSRRLERTGALACLLVLAASIVDQAFLTPRFWPGLGVRPHFFPEGAVAFLERHRLDGRVFNSYRFGGYLIWRRWPANQVLIDGRFDGILFDEALFEAYLQALRSSVALDQTTAAYDVEILVLDAHQMGYIGPHSGWARVYWDWVAQVFVRRGGRHADLIAAHEYRLTGPAADVGYLAAYRRDPEAWGRALRELRRAVAENPENALAWLGLAQEYRAAGPAVLEDRLEALTRATSLLTRGPAAGLLHGERAEALLQLGRFDEAKTAAQKALLLDRKLRGPRWILASVAERRGAWAEAGEQLHTLLAGLEPGHPEADIIQRRLEIVERMQRRGG